MAAADATIAPPRLRVLSGPLAGAVFDLIWQRISVGRADDNLVVLDDMYVSQHHALLVREGNSFKIRDLVSTNGTYVNGERVASQLLRDGDTIALGPVSLRYEAGQFAAAAHAPEPSGAAAERRYCIIGADGRTYGPADADMIRQWIAAGYANAHTWVPAAVRHHWKQLGEFPEFADALRDCPAPDRIIGVPPASARLIGPLPVAQAAAPPAAAAAPATPTTAQPTRRRQLRRVRVAVVAAAAVVLLSALLGAAYRLGWLPVTARRGLLADPAYHAAAAAEQAGDYAALLQQAQRLLQRYPDSALAHYIHGVALGKLGALADAVAAFQQAIQRQPDYVDAWNNLGWAYSQQGKLTEAVVAFRQTTRLKPDDPQAWNNLGGVYSAQGKHADAVAAYNKAIELRPDYAEAHYNLGIAHADQQRYVEAVEAFRTALRHKPDLAQAWYNLGVISQTRSLNEEAVLFYQQALKVEPQYADAWAGLVKAYLKLNQPDQASAAARELKRLDPAKAAALADELSRTASSAH